MNPNAKNTAKSIDDATKTNEEPIRDVTDQHAEAVAGGFQAPDGTCDGVLTGNEPPAPK